MLSKASGNAVLELLEQRFTEVQGPGSRWISRTEFDQLCFDFGLRLTALRSEQAANAGNRKVIAEHLETLSERDSQINGLQEARGYDQRHLERLVSSRDAAVSETSRLHRELADRAEAMRKTGIWSLDALQRLDSARDLVRAASRVLDGMRQDTL